MGLPRQMRRAEAWLLGMFVGLFALRLAAVCLVMVVRPVPTWLARGWPWAIWIDLTHMTKPISNGRSPAAAGWDGSIQSLKADLARRLRSLRRGEREWDLRTSELVASSMAKFLATVQRSPKALPHVQAWRLLASIGRGVLIDAVRRRQVRKAAIRRIQSEVKPSVIGPTSSESADLDLLQQVLASLSPHERDLLERRVRGFTWGQIADELAVDQRTLRQRWVSMRQRLQPLRPEPRP